MAWPDKEMVRAECQALVVVAVAVCLLLFLLLVSFAFLVQWRLPVVAYLSQYACHMDAMYLLRLPLRYAIAHVTRIFTIQDNTIVLLCKTFAQEVSTFGQV